MNRMGIPQLTVEQTFSLEIMFKLATELGPLTSFAQELETLAAVRYPGFRVVWEGKALTSYLQRSALKIIPLLDLDDRLSGLLIFHYLLDLRLRQDDDRPATGWSRDLFWLARLAYCVNPPARRAWSEVMSLDYEELFGPAGPVQVSDTDWQFVLDAFIGWETLRGEAEGEDSNCSTGAIALSYEEQLYQRWYPVLGNCVYGQRDIETAVERLIDGAVPFSGSKEKILVVVCSDSRSLELQNLAQKLVEREGFDDAILGFKRRHLRPEELQWVSRLADLPVAYSLGMRPNQIAEDWIRFGWVKTDHAEVTPEGEVVKAPRFEGDHLASGARAVRKGRKMLEAAGLDVKKGPNLLKSEPD
jgi:hypothetical protein